ncbi:MAG: ATP-dependent sacrificial sulfur transferase LarE [Deltaproteobacteria bacterium]|nr:ATP-dependent sacrificial sulfur transferase LarE [Deltaproteobacteria bacterium]
MDAKYQQLEAILHKARRALIAFSAGVDSTFLLKVAHDTLGSRAVALTASSASVPPGELESAKAFVQQLGCQHIVLDSHELDNPFYAQNPVNRCFFCKDELYRICREEADKIGIETIFDGTNLDDLKDHRPGLKAAEQWHVQHPLVEAEMTKDDIRRYSRALDLPTWNKPSSPCLSSRFPYGTAIDLAKLKRVGACEIFLKEKGFREFRVRYHGDLARIEVAQTELDRLFDKDLRSAIVEKFKAVGFKYISLDLQGFRSGSLNEGLKVNRSIYLRTSGSY